MNINRRTYAIIFLATLAAVLLLIDGCGSKNSAAPNGATITINPSTLSLTNPYEYGDVTEFYSAVVKYSDGTPIPYTGVIVTGSFAVPVVSTELFTSPRYQFYNSANMPVNNGFEGETDKNGVFQFSILIYSEVTLTAGGPLFPNIFTDNILVTSGTAQAGTTINVTTQ